MNFEELSGPLGTEGWKLKGALRRGTLQRASTPLGETLVFKKDFGPLERGTTVFLSPEVEVVRGFPKIKRAFYLRPAVERHFQGKVSIEEKLNGYNVRVFLREGEVLALTRGGYYCPYTTRKLRDDPRIGEALRARGDLMICGEAVGLENPYVPHRYPEAEGFGFFAFDVREKATNRPLPLEERRGFLEEYGIPAVRHLGTHRKEEVTDRVFQVLEEIAEENREGVVLKDPRMEIAPLKYTSSTANTGDLQYAFRFPYDYGVDFFLSRIIREGYQALEWEEEGGLLAERARRLGESLLYPMVETMRRVREGKRVYEDHLIRVGREEEIEELLEYLQRQRVACTLGDVWEEDGELLARIRRPKPATQDKIDSVLRGQTG
jgi:putative ATP-dependent DNA ligase